MDRLFDQYVVVVPALFPLAYLLAGLALYSLLSAVGRRPKIEGNKVSGGTGRFLSAYFHWMLKPFIRFALFTRVTPNVLTGLSLAAAAGAGVAVATGHYAVATWVYVLAGIFDLMDGRVARMTNRQTTAGAFLDSVLDRWGEIFVFAGMAWQLRGNHFMFAPLLALGGSMMVSYTRARGESLGVVAGGGAMQRPERLILVCLGFLITALVDASSASAYVPEVLGTTSAIVGVLSTVTAIGRLRDGYRMLEQRESPTAERAPAPAVESSSADSAAAAEAPAAPAVARVFDFNRSSGSSISGSR